MSKEITLKVAKMGDVKIIYVPKRCTDIAIGDYVKITKLMLVEPVSKKEVQNGN